MATRKHLSAAPLLIAALLACLPASALAAEKQTITFTSAPPSPARVNGTYEVAATGGGSGNPVTFAVDKKSEGCQLEHGNLVKFLTPGTCLIDANQAGNAQYEPAATKQQQIKIEKALQAINFTSTPPSKATARKRGGPCALPAPRLRR